VIATRLGAVACASIALFFLTAADRAPPHIVIDGQGASLAFDDEFDRLALDRQATGKGWAPWFKTFNVRYLKGNQELQVYSDQDYLVSHSLPLRLDPFRIADGSLIITANPLPRELAARLPDKDKAQLYTSGMISSELSFAQIYGYFEARLRLPLTPGTWPAFWLIPKSGHWPPEIDIFEAVGQQPRRVNQNAIHPDKSSAHTFIETATDLSGWHVFGLLWTPQKLEWFVDGAKTKQMTNFISEPMYMILNLAVGGRWPGPPPSDAPFPTSMAVDYVRVYALESLLPP
jgi:beta-glucanase (GH16 family)